MRLIDADKFLGYLIFSKHIDSLKCKEVEEAVEMCKVDVFEQIRAEIEEQKNERCFDDDDMYVYRTGLDDALEVIDKYR